MTETVSDLTYMTRVWRIFAAPDLEGHADNDTVCVFRAKKAAKAKTGPEKRTRKSSTT